MMRALIVVVIAITLSAGAAGVLVSRAGPSTADLDSDIVLVTAQITEAKTEAARYAGGVLALEIELRSSILKSTRAMLEQKRTSVLRGISLAYHDPAPRTVSPDNADIGAELAKAKADAAEARMEAAQYSGGMIQMMALMREATAKVTQVSIEQRIALARIGMPMPTLSAPNAVAAPTPGKTSSDKDAL